MVGERSIDFSRPLFDFIRDSRKIRTLDELSDRYGKVVSQFGFNVFLCTDLSGRDGNHCPQHMFGRWNRQWEARYFSRGYFRHDACLKHLAHTNEAFSWEELLRSGCADKVGKRIFDEASEYRAKQGVVVPIRTADNQLSIVVLMGEHADVSDDAIAAIEVASIYFRQCGRDIYNANANIRPTSFSPRQREIIQWLAQGKRNAEIADIMGLSVKTVDNHIDRAKRSRNLTTQPQLVLTAFKEGIVQI